MLSLKLKRLTVIGSWFSSNTCCHRGRLWVDRIWVLVPSGLNVYHRSYDSTPTYELTALWTFMTPRFRQRWGSDKSGLLSTSILLVRWLRHRPGTYRQHLSDHQRRIWPFNTTCNPHCILSSAPTAYLLCTATLITYNNNYNDLRPVGIWLSFSFGFTFFIMVCL